MRFGVVGINHKAASLNIRELFAHCCLKRFGSRFQLHLRHAFVLLSTCNRTEIYFSSDDLALTHVYILQIPRSEVPEAELDQLLYSFFDEDCLKHLSRVTSGLDSAILGETEIQGQVKAAYQQASNYARLPKDLHFLFQKGLKNGKLVRTHFPTVRGIPDIEHALLALTNEKIQEGPILFVGASKINLKILSFFKNKGLPQLTLCNRTDERAELSSEHYGVQMLPWGELSNWKDYEMVIFGTKSPRYLISTGLLPSIEDKKLLIDLSVPRNVDPALGHHPLIDLFNIDQIHHILDQRRGRIATQLETADELLSTSIQRQLRGKVKKRTRVLQTEAI